MEFKEGEIYLKPDKNKPENYTWIKILSPLETNELGEKYIVYAAYDYNKKIWHKYEVRQYSCNEFNNQLKRVKSAGSVE
ncbi:MAG: hypothetical protein V1874_05730 [Spirochaetota bacterium]